MNNNTNEEIWEDISGWEGLYQVSSLGRVKSLTRIVERKDGTRARIQGRIMKLSFNRQNGYYSVRLSKSGNFKLCYVHRLVATEFVKNPDNKPEINHKDEVKVNNSSDNLEWVTRLENNTYNGRSKKIADKVAEINIENGHYENLAKAKAKRVKRINLETNEEALYNSLTEAARENNGDRTLISRVAKGEFRQAYGYGWEFN